MPGSMSSGSWRRHEINTHHHRRRGESQSIDLPATPDGKNYPITGLGQADTLMLTPLTDRTPCIAFRTSASMACSNCSFWFLMRRPSAMDLLRLASVVRLRIGSDTRSWTWVVGKFPAHRLLSD